MLVKGYDELVSGSKTFLGISWNGWNVGVCKYICMIGPSTDD